MHKTMDKDLKKLKPELLWTRFSEICAVPRPSHHEEKIREYIIDFAKRHNLDYTVDASGDGEPQDGRPAGSP